MISRSILKNRVIWHLHRTQLLLGHPPRYYSDGASQNQGSRPASAPPAKVNAEVPGLSSAVVHSATEPVGPGVDPKKTGAYKVPEYFCYNNMSYFEAEIEMSKYRLPQPSSLKK